jgi:hypothetical protein
MTALVIEVREVGGRQAALIRPPSASMRAVTSPTSRAKLAELATSDGSLGSWNPGTDSKYGVWTLRTPPSHVLIGGDFTHVDGQHHWHYAQFLR